MHVLRPKTWQCEACDQFHERLVCIDGCESCILICQDCLAKAFQMLKDAAEEDPAHNI